ncbi:MAG: hypothetical protein EAZ30_15040 [Betaproteobacteria bacterium]|nr:MAG: hypothetical protein EAZ30_15040 [Betaproteobacteria bacterium]
MKPKPVWRSMALNATRAARGTCATLGALICIFLFISMLNVVPLKPRELGWYARDQYLQVQTSAPFSSSPQPLSHGPTSAGSYRAPAPVRAASINRNQSFDIAFWTGVFPWLLLTFAWLHEARELGRLRQMFRSLM